MTPSDIIRRRLHNQGLARADFHEPEEAVRWLVAAQAQDFAGAKWSIGARVAGATDSMLEQAFDEGSILRTHVLRPTWHFVTPDDIRWLLELTAPRVQGKNAPIYRRLGLDGRTLGRAAELLARALRGGRHLTREELRQVLREGGLDPDGELRLPYILMNAELEGVICSGPRRGKSFTYALLEERAPGARRLERHKALAELAARYFRSRGPASVHDFARWSGLTVREARAGLGEAAPELTEEHIAGEPYWRAPNDPCAAGLLHAHLLSIYDEYVSGYKDRSAIRDPFVWERLMRLGNALTHMVLLDGRIVGSWKRSVTPTRLTVRVDLFRQPTEDGRRAIEEAARRYASFLGTELRLEGM